MQTVHELLSIFIFIVNKIFHSEALGAFQCIYTLVYEQKLSYLYIG